MDYPRKVFQDFSTPIFRSAISILLPIITYAFFSENKVQALLIGMAMYLTFIWFFACVRFYTIQFYEDKIEIINRWRVVGDKSWVFDFKEIYSVKLNRGNSVDVFDAKLTIDGKSFYLLMGKHVRTELNQELENQFKGKFESELS